MPIEFVGPAFTGRFVHLSGVGFSDDASKETGRFHCVRNGQLFDLDLEILRQQFTNEH